MQHSMAQHGMCAHSTTQRRTPACGTVGRFAATAGRFVVQTPQHSTARRSVMSPVAQATEVQVDLTTGEEIAPNSVKSARCGYTVQAGGLKWAYRKTDVENSEYPPILLLHGVGSCSYTFRNTMDLLGKEGFECIAPDWIGHGDSDKPSASEFGYDANAYVRALKQFVDAIELRKPFVVVTQGFVLGQYGMLFAAQHEDDVDKLIVFNTPLSLKTKLRPELAAYKNPIPFMRPDPKKPFAADLFAASGLSYALQYDDAMVYRRPYDEDESSAASALSAIMASLDFNALLREVDDRYMTWRKPSVVLFGTRDPFISLESAFDWLSSKRTNMQFANVQAKIGHMPQEDYPEAVHEVISRFLRGEDVTLKGTVKPGLSKTLTDS